MKALQSIGYPIEEFPVAVINKQQNISLKFSPIADDVELITQCSVNKDFDAAFSERNLVRKDNLVWNIISFDDLITSKIKAAGPKYLLDVQELKRIRKLKKKLKN